MNRTRLLASAFLLAAAAPTHAANLIVNGSFEGGAFLGGTSTSWNGIPDGGTAVTGWVAGTNGFDWHQAVEFGPAKDGYRMVDLTLGSRSGAISQSFATVAGRAYELRFAVTAPGAFFGAAALEVSVGDAVASYSVSRSPTFPLSWETKTLAFRATSGVTTLVFTGPSSSAYWGPVIDDVSVTVAIPEPETYAMMLAGLGMLGFVARRRKQAATA